MERDRERDKKKMRSDPTSADRGGLVCGGKYLRYLWFQMLSLKLQMLEQDRILCTVICSLRRGENGDRDRGEMETEK
jgi:hypothetical protein